MFFVSDAMAAGEAAAQVGGMEGFLMQVVPLVVIFAVFWFFLIRPSGGFRRRQARCDPHAAHLGQRCPPEGHAEDLSSINVHALKCTKR